MQLIKQLGAAFVVCIIVILMNTCGKSVEYRPRRRFFRRACH